MDEAHHSHQDSLHGVDQRDNHVAGIRRRDKDKQDNQRYPYPFVLLHSVWLERFELPLSWSQTRRFTKLSYSQVPHSSQATSRRGYAIVAEEGFEPATAGL